MEGSEVAEMNEVHRRVLITKELHDVLCKEHIDRRDDSKPIDHYVTHNKSCPTVPFLHSCDEFVSIVKLTRTLYSVYSDI